MRLSLDTTADTVRICCYEVSFIRLLLQRFGCRYPFTDIPLVDGAWIVDGGLVLLVGLLGMVVADLLVHLFSFEIEKA